MLFAGKYELLAPLGEGAMGVVYRARHILLDLDMAVKVLRPQYSADESFRKRFMREARIPMAFVHKRSVTLRDFGVGENDALYLAMDLCPGQPLSQVIKSAGRLDPVRVAQISLQVLEVLIEAHDVGILHRDIKPDNIMVDGANGMDQVKVMDFGIAKLMEGDAHQTNLTAGSAIGTPLYMSPEQAAGEHLDQRSDLYGLGIVMFEMLTGAPPFQSERVQALLMKHLTQPVPPTLLELGIDPELTRIVHKALAKTAQERFANARELSAALQSWLEQLRTRPLGETLSTELVRPEPAPELGLASGLPVTPLAQPSPRPSDSASFRGVRPSAEREDDPDDDNMDSVSFVRPAQEVPHGTGAAGRGEETMRTAAGALAALQAGRRELSRNAGDPGSDSTSDGGRAAGPALPDVDHRDGASDALRDQVSDEPDSPRRFLGSVTSFLTIPLGFLLLGMLWLLASDEVPGAMAGMARAFPEVIRPLTILPGYSKLLPLLPTDGTGSESDANAASSATPGPVPTVLATPAPVKPRPGRVKPESTPTPKPARPTRPSEAGAYRLDLQSIGADDLAYVPSQKVLLVGPVPGGGDKAEVNGDEVYADGGQLTATLSLEDGRNEVRVVGRGEKGSETRRLMLVVDRQKPVLVLEGPSRRSLIRLPSFTIAGQARDEHLKRLTIDGKAVELAEGERFSQSFDLSPGLNHIVLVAEDLAGNRTTETLEIRHPAPGLPGRGQRPPRGEP